LSQDLTFRPELIAIKTNPVTDRDVFERLSIDKRIHEDKIEAIRKVSEKENTFSPKIHAPKTEELVSARK
jgi:hypothetical protein